MKKKMLFLRDFLYFCLQKFLWIRIWIGSGLIDFVDPDLDCAKLLEPHNFNEALSRKNDAAMTAVPTLILLIFVYVIVQNSKFDNI
jgi:hypothetical protein